MISIIIPIHSQHEMTHKCLEAIRVHSQDYELIIIDNGSESEFIPEAPATVFRNEENLGFPKAVNQGIKVTQGDIIVIMNNDVIVTKGWMDTLQKHLANGFDMIGPVTNSVSGPQQVLIDPYEDMESLEIASQLNKIKYEGQSYPWHRLVFYCVAIRREVIDKIGLLDEIYTPGNHEDDDYGMRAIEAGFRLGIALDCYVHHFGSITHKAMDLDYRELLTRNYKIFIDKWGDKYQDMVRKNNEKATGEITFTGERAIPLDPGTPPDVMAEHWARYKLAIPFVKGKRVLDVACGAGYGSGLLAETAKEVTGGDISSETIDYCRKHYSNATFDIFNICNIPYPETSFDVIVSFETIEHIPDGNIFLDEIVRVLDKDGTLLISCPLGGNCGNPYHKAYYQKETFEPLLRKYFNEVKMLYQRGETFFVDSISPEYCNTFTGEYAMAICTGKKEATS